jgi:hypothetical protein
MLQVGATGIEEEEGKGKEEDDYDDDSSKAYYSTSKGWGSNLAPALNHSLSESLFLLPPDLLCDNLIISVVPI